MHDSITQEYLKTIVDYDPITTKLVPKPAQPLIGLTATKFGQRHLLIGGSKHSMANLAYLYHHGKTIARVKHLDGNNLNFAPNTFATASFCHESRASGMGKIGRAHV